jgi:hypothetical protein
LDSVPAKIPIIILITIALEVTKMTKGLYEITTGEAFEVRANSEDEALAIFHVSQGQMDIEDYPQFNITQDDLDSVMYVEANTVAEHILE